MACIIHVLQFDTIKSPGVVKIALLIPFEPDLFTFDYRDFSNLNIVKEDIKCAKSVYKLEFET